MQALQHKLKERKLSDNESYEDVIWDLMEDTLELSEETKKELVTARQDIRAGKGITHAQLKKELKL